MTLTSPIDAVAMRFQVRWLDPTAQAVQEELIEAGSAAEIRQRMAVAELVVLSIGRASPIRRRVFAQRTDLDLAWWCRELRTLLEAGMTVVEVIETLHAQPLGPARAQVHAALLQSLQHGRSLSDAMQATGVFPAVLLAGIKAGERTSALVESLDEYLRYSDLIDQLRKQVTSAAIYPAVVVSLGGLITLFLLLYVMPRFARMYGELQGPVSLATQMLMGLSRLLAQYGTWIGAAAVALVLAAALAWRMGALQSIGMALAERIPAIRRHLDEFRRAKLFQSMALMFRGGYSIDESLGQCAALGLGIGMSDAIQSARQGLARGLRVSVVMERAGLTDTVSLRLLAVGERTGNFDRILQTIAERHAANFTTFVERTTRVVEPVLLLLVALLVGGIVVAMYMPVFDVASSIR